VLICFNKLNISHQTTLDPIQDVLSRLLTNVILIAYLSSNLQIQDHDLSQKMILIFQRLDAFIDPHNEKLRHLIEALACLPSQGLDL
jgi:hypothetical protein